MTQTLGATRQTQLKPGVIVRHRQDAAWAGEVRKSDDFYDTLKLRGVADRAQVLVHWPDAQLCTWERVTDLTTEETR